MVAPSSRHGLQLAARRPEGLLRRSCLAHLSRSPKVRLDSKVGLKNYAQPAEQGASSVRSDMLPASVSR